MIAEIFSVGTELLLGNTLDTNANYISQGLAKAGISCFHRTTVGDNHERLFAAVKQALTRSDILIFSGGLGPTEDDLTKETVADAMGVTLALDEDELIVLKDRFKKYGHDMTPNNIKQVMLPQKEDGIVLKNPNGTAPGAIFIKDGKTAIVMPGPPNEMIPMFDSQVMAYLKKLSDAYFYSKTLHIFGVGESAAEHILKDLIDSQSNPTIAPYAKPSEVTFRITANCRDDEEGESICAPVIAQICSRLGDCVYSTDDETLQQVCLKLLKEQKKTLCTAESCTAGMLASTIGSIPGCSECFIDGVVTYSNESKIKRLNVNPSTLNEYGAVSEQVAREMADGARSTSNADIAVSITGIAGPGGGSAEKPVGLVYIGLSTKKRTMVKELHLTGARERIRWAATLNALDLIRRELLFDK